MIEQSKTCGEARRTIEIRNLKSLGDLRLSPLLFALSILCALLFILFDNNRNEHSEKRHRIEGGVDHEEVCKSNRLIGCISDCCAP
jgi:hypothetical protein